MTADRTDRWWPASVVALVAGGVGMLTARPLVLTMAVVGVVFATFARVGSAPEPSLSVERTVDDREPAPGETVRVTVALRNEGEQALPDLRVVDGVPAALEVVAGSPRHGAALRPGATTSFEYDVRAERGEHGFEPATVLARDLAGAREVETAAGAETVVTCSPPLSGVDLRSQTSRYAGDVPTDGGASGLEFHATREYRPGDAMSRVDWDRLAKTGELATVEFREERAATVVVAVDARRYAYRAAPTERRHAVEHAVSAAGQLFGALIDGGNRVGLTALGPEPCWLPPAAGRDALVRARSLLATHPALSYAPPAGDPAEPAIAPEHDPVDAVGLAGRLPTDAQVVVCSPMLDDAVATAVARLDARGHAATVLSPDVTAADTPGRRLAALQRANRLGRLRRAGAWVVDWTPTEPLAKPLERARRA